MSETPTIDGYEYALTCTCGGDIIARGTMQTGPNGEVESSRNSKPITEGTYECLWCEKVWELKWEHSHD